MEIDDSTHVRCRCQVPGYHIGDLFMCKNICGLGLGILLPTQADNERLTTIKIDQMYLLHVLSPEVLICNHVKHVFIQRQYILKQTLFAAVVRLSLHQLCEAMVTSEHILFVLLFKQRVFLVINFAHEAMTVSVLILNINWGRLILFKSTDSLNFPSFESAQGINTLDTEA